ncbi:MAG: ATP-dependent Clp protease ATP-binding subunit [Nitrospira sp.]
MDNSPAITLAWQLACQESTSAGKRFIDPIQFIAGMTKLEQVCRSEDRERTPERQDNWKEIRAEVTAFVGALRRAGVDPTELRRTLRERAGKGQYCHAKNERIHRSDSLRTIFDRAAAVADEMKNRQVKLAHILIAVLEKHELIATKLLMERGVDIEGLMRYLRESPSENATPATPFLNRYGRDLTQLARDGKLGIVVGRRDETLQVARTLSRTTKRNPVLVGEPGVGKTAVVEALAQRIAEGNITPFLRDKRIIELNVGSLVAGTKYRGEFEERLTNILDESTRHRDVILFIDEIHTVIGAGKTEGATDAANLMKPALGRGEITCIGATTTTEYHRYIEKDPALERRLQPITIKEPSRSEAIQILNNVFGSLGDVVCEGAAIAAAVDLSIRFIPARYLPDKAIDLMEEACARVRVPSLSFHGGQNTEEVLRVTSEQVALVVSALTGIPVSRLTEAERERLLQMAASIKEKVIGQDEAVDKICDAVKAQRVGLKGGKRRGGVFLFLGPTGVGKTALAKALAEFLFGSEAALIRIDMSEFKEKHSVSRLIGAPPGYVGYEQEGQLTGRLRKKPYAVVLLDEVEKAHPEVFDVFLPVFDDGQLTDAAGQTIDARNAIFVMTSNIGGELLGRNPLGFIAGENGNTMMVSAEIHIKLQQTFRAEFVNRIDDIVVFRPLSPNSMTSIARNMLKDVSQRLADQGISVDFDNSVVDLLCREGYDEANGARALQRAIDRRIGKPLSELLIQAELAEGGGVLAKMRGDEVIFEITKTKEMKENQS